MSEISKASRAKVIWLTGLPGSGKSTIALALQNRLSEKGIPAVVLDGDDLRQGLNSNLGYTDEDRLENARRAAHVADLLRRQGIWAIAALITPREPMRQLATRIIGTEHCVLVHVKASVETCSKRDPKGLYQKAKKGFISNFTGVSAPFDPPAAPDLTLDTEMYDLTQTVDHLYSYIFGLQTDPF
ncbi:adenylyl-sulfate kinase [Schleiferia thermophila]|uniref:adenylyl-sulfate kinase n=1 Tax=Schleiferia thermophila TaxID=884107 RepID=UPI003EEB9F81